MRPNLCMRAPVRPKTRRIRDVPPEICSGRYGCADLTVQGGVSVTVNILVGMAALLYTRHDT